MKQVLSDVFARESTRGEAINYMTLVTLLVDKGLVTEKEVVKARANAAELVDARAKAERKDSEQRIQSILRRTWKADSASKHYAIVSHQHQLRKNKTSRFRGVDYCRRDRKWRARISWPGESKQTSLGYFEYEEDAARAYNIAAQEAYGEHANLNDLSATRSKKAK
ncbi:MAG: AP2 domain-containing protein [Pirellulaceae bacterium]